MIGAAWPLERTRAAAAHHRAGRLPARSRHNGLAALQRGVATARFGALMRRQLQRDTFEIGGIAYFSDGVNGRPARADREPHRLLGEGADDVERLVR
jgi:hypothetical protein